MDRIPIDFNPLTGLWTYWSYDEAADETQISYEQDVEPLIEQNKRLYNDAGHFRGENNDFWHVATIPAGVQMKWLVEEGIDVWKPDDWPAVKRKLNDPEYRYLRTGHFRV